MVKNNAKINIHLTQNEDGQYFWNRIKFSQIQKAILVICVLLACLPIFVSLTVRPWIGWLNGPESAKNCYYRVVGEYWHTIVYLLGGCTLFCVLLGAIQRYNRGTLNGFWDKKWLLSHWLSINMLLLLIWSVVSTCFAKDKNYALWGDWYCHEGLILYFFYGAFFLAGSWLTGKQMKYVVEILTAVSAMTGILVLWYGNEFAGWFYLESKKELMFHHYNHYGYYLSICVPLAIGLFLQDMNKSIFIKILRILEMWLLFNAVAVNSVRGSFLAIALVLICWNLYIFTLQKQKIKGILLVDILFLSTILFLNSGSNLFSRMWGLAEDISAVASAENKQAAMDKAGSLRGVLWRKGLDFIAEKPLVGFGPGNLIEPYTLAKCHTSSPHNDLILIAVSLGIPGLVFYVSGLMGHLVGLCKYIKNMSVFEVTVYAGMGCYILGSFVGVSLYYTACYYFLLLGFTYGIYREQYRKQQEAKEEQNPIAEAEPACEK